MKTSRFILTLLAIVALTGCSTINVKSTYDETVDFRAYATYSYMDQPADLQGLAAGNDILAGRIERAVDGQLAANGYRKIENGTPDFYVVFHAGAQQRVSGATIDNYGYGYGYGLWGRSGDVRVQRYTEGALVVDIVDAKKKELVWRGSAQGAVNPNKGPEQLNEAVAKLFEEFPPQPNI